MKQWLRHFSLQFRLMALFLVPSILIVFSIPLILSQHKLLIDTLARAGLIADAAIQAGWWNTVFLMSLVILAVVFSFILTLSVSKSILEPLDNLRTAISTYRTGQPSLLEDKNKDEFGTLTHSVNQLVQNLTLTYMGLEERINQRTQALGQRVMHLQAAAELARDTTNIANLDSLLDRAVQLLRDRFDYYFVGIYLLDPDNQYAVLRAGTDPIGKILASRKHRILVGEVGMIGYVTVTGEERVLNRVESDFNYQRDQLLADTQSQATLPLKIGPQVIGALDVHSKKVDAFDSGVMAVLQIMADQLSVAIQNASLVSDLQSRIAETRQLYQRYAHESWSASRLGEKANGYEYDMISISPMQTPLPEEILEKLSDGQPVISKEGNGENGLKKSVIYAPLMMYNHLIGVVGLEEQSGDRNWTEEEISVLQTITNQIALALDNSRLLEETQNRSDQIRLLQEVTSIAASQAKLVDLLDLVAEKLQQELNLSYCDVLWFDPDGISAVFIASSSAHHENEDVEVVDTRIPVIDNPLIQQLMDSRQTLDIYDLVHNPLVVKFHTLIRQRRLENMLVVPLLLRNEVNGALILSVQDSTRRFTEDEMNLMNQISLQISSALEVAHSFELATQRAERERLIGEATRRIRETMDVPTILRTAAQELRITLDIPDVTVRLVQNTAQNEFKPSYLVQSETGLSTEAGEISEQNSSHKDKLDQDDDKTSDAVAVS